MLTLLSARHRKQFYVRPIHAHPSNLICISRYILIYIKY